MCQLTDNNIQVDNYFERENQIDSSNVLPGFTLFTSHYFIQTLFEERAYMWEMYMEQITV